MSVPEHSSEHPPGFLPLGDLAALRSAATWRLLIPSDTRSALAAARQDKEAAIAEEQNHRRGFSCERDLRAFRRRISMPFRVTTRVSPRLHPISWNVLPVPGSRRSRSTGVTG